MKIKSLLFTSAIFALSLASCSSDDDNGYTERTPILFNSMVEGIATTSQAKASGTTWDNPDYIGVFMKTGTGLDNIVDGGSNKKYSTPGTGSFSPANPNTDALHFPENGSNVDFIAYYPYVQTLTNNTYEINVGTQTSQEAIDLLYSNNATGLNKNSSDVTLNFKHQLAKVVFTINAGNGISDLTGLVVTIKGTNTKANYALATGAISGENTVADIVAKTTTASTLQSVSEAIILPAGGTTGRTVTFVIPSGTFTWDVPNDHTFLAGKKNTYTVELKKGGATSVYPTGNIEDWGPGSNENIVIDLGEGGDGTKASPYAISQVTVAKVGETGKWVTGYIVGSTAKTKAFGTPSTENILLAASANETDESKCIPIDISSSAVKTNLDIVANASLIGKQVKVQGDIVNNIFSNTLSMTNIIDQEGGATPGPGPGTEATIIDEKFNDAGDYSSNRPKVNVFTDWDMKAPITYSDPYGTWADIRSTSTVSPSLWLPAYGTDKESALRIEGISSGYTKMKLTYSIAPNNATNANPNHIIIKCDGVNNPTQATGTFTGNNQFIQISLDIPDNTTVLEFYSGSANTIGYRIDNILLKGTK